MTLTGANLEAAAMWDALISRALTDTTQDLEYQQVYDSLLDGCLPYELSAYESIVAGQNPWKVSSGGLAAEQMGGADSCLW